MLTKTYWLLALVAFLASFVNCAKKEKKYVVVMKKMTWYEAFQACQNENMEMSSIESQAEANKLIKLLESHKKEEGPNRGFWIGGHRTKKSSKEYVWAKSGRTVKFNLWAPGEPNNDEGNERCMEMFKDSATKKWLWNDLPCVPEFVKKEFVCQTY